MWSFKGSTFVWCFLLVSTTWALPTAKIENESDFQKPEPMITVDVIQMAADEKPTDNSKPSELAVDPKPIDVKPTEQTKPNEPPSSPSSAPTTTILETIPLSVGPPRRQFLYDQRQDGKYNIRADLENFVILVVPSSGNSLLDLLKRSGQRQPQQQHHNKRLHHLKSHHKKYQTASSGKPVEVKRVTNRLDYLNRPEGEVETPTVGEFIEGRTPYHVDIQSDEILQPAAYGAPGSVVRSIADIPLINLDENTASTSVGGGSDPTVVAVTGKQEQQHNFSSMPSTTTSNTESSSARLPKSITIGGYGNPFSNLNTVLLTPNAKSYGNDQQHDNVLSKNYNNYFSRKHSVQIVDVDRRNTMGVNERNDNNNNNNDNNNGNDVVNSANLINSPTSSDLIDLTDSKTSFNSLNVGNIDRLALAGDSTTKTDADLANAQWELTLLGAEEQCGPDRRRDSYGVCQFVPADYATT